MALSPHPPQPPAATFKRLNRTRAELRACLHVSAKTRVRLSTSVNQDLNFAVREFLHQPLPYHRQICAPPALPQSLSAELVANRTEQGWFLTCEMTLVIVGVGRRALVVDEEGGLERRRDGVEVDRGMGKVETIGKVVGWAIRVPERGQVVGGLDEFQNASKVVRCVRNVSSLRVR